MTAAMIVLVAIGLAGLSLTFSLTERRLAQASGIAADPEPETAAAPTPAVVDAALPAGDPGIVSVRARCACGDPLETHPSGRCEGCTCRRFSYVGGLVAKAS